MLHSRNWVIGSLPPSRCYWNSSFLSITQGGNAPLSVVPMPYLQYLHGAIASKGVKKLELECPNGTSPHTWGTILCTVLLHVPCTYLITPCCARCVTGAYGYLWNSQRIFQALLAEVARAVSVEVLVSWPQQLFNYMTISNIVHSICVLTYRLRL